MEQYTAHHEPASKGDVFDMEACQKEQQGQGAVPPEQAPASTAHKPDIGAAIADRLLKLSPAQLAMITAGIIVLGLAWSRMAAHVPATPSGDSQLLTTDFQQLQKAPVAEQALPATAPYPEQQHAAQDQTQQPVAPTGDAERAIIRTALEDLNARVARLESEASLAGTNAVAPTNPPAKAEPQRLARPSATRKASPTAHADALPILAGYALNTIYQNQAWIEHDGATYAVQVGDKIGALAITGIDPRTRRVLTPNGQIR